MVIGLKGIIAGCILLLGTACRPPVPVDYSVLTVTDSPAATWQALVVRQQELDSAGALSTAVFVRTKGDTALGERVFVVNGHPTVEAHWKNEKRLVISHDGKKADVYASALTAGALSIGYEHLPTGESAPGP